LWFQVDDNRACSSHFIILPSALANSSSMAMARAGSFAKPPPRKDFKNLPPGLTKLFGNLS